ncbi:DNA-binding SARP family transcriptional activator [Arthrobacter sp. B2I5]|uniref:AfsR/SARP family transcriptional regulator n=1 Tax=Arthrobacter sp. B2I5 TaxID=3042266 RepID=UPI0027897CFE|nr:BTAD domain-containing putative transcriptional regulator [Arthrobacter sp. B2I5]MDQ0824578.1 DNA-binding SARP family transcriptional activator [Arthrobacter sp. B2I5]
MGDDDCGIFKLDLMHAWQLRQEGRTICVAARQQRLIAALAVRGTRLRTYLAGMLWPEYPDANALESLRVTVHLITRQLPGLLVKSGALLSLDRRVDVDLHRVRAALAEAAKANNCDAASLLPEIRDVDLLPGWYEDWVMFEQSRLQHDQVRAFTLVSRQLAARGENEAAADAAIAALEIEPLYESAVRELVMSELAQGNVASALLAYDKYAGQLQSEIGVRPSEGLSRLMQEKLNRQGRNAQENSYPLPSTAV